MSCFYHLTEEEDVIVLTGRAHGATKRVTSVMFAGRAFQLPLRIEIILLGIGIMALLPPQVLVRYLARKQTSPNKAGEDKRDIAVLVRERD